MWGSRFSALLAVVCASATLFAQGTTSRLIGVVSDSTGAVIGGATVRLVNEGTNASFETKSADNGAYFFESLQPGSYTVQTEAAGFKKYIAKGNAVSIGQPATVNVTLEVGAVTESVEVSGAYEAVQTSTSGNIGNLFTERTIRDLPIVGTRGRNPLDLVLRQPGVVSGGNTGGLVHVHGARDRAWNFTLDGIDTNETSAGGSNFSPLRPNPDSLAEFRVITSNPTAEFGRNSGAQVAMVTASGTNEFHGTGFWFYRTPRFNANEWESNVNNVGKRQFVQNIGGGSIGGPVVRNKTFFFGNLQILRARESAVTNRTVLTQSARQGVLRYVRNGRNGPVGSANAAVDAAGNPLPGLSIGTYNVAQNDPDRIGLSSQTQALITPTPLPNNFAGGDGLNTAFYTFSALQFEKQYDAVTKVDHILNSKNTFYGRIAWGSQDTNCDRVNGGAPFFVNGECVVNTVRRPRNYAFNWRWNPSPTVTNEFVFGRNNFFFDFFYPTTDIAQPNIVAPLSLTVPLTTTKGNKRSLTTWQFVDNVSWLRGAHSIKTGINFRLQRHTDTRGSVACCNVTQDVTFGTGTAAVDPTRFNLPADINVANDRPTFQSAINWLLGRVGDTQRAFVARGDAFVAEPFEFTAKYDEYDFFIQDTWKVRRNLTVDLGLRWEGKLTPGNSDNRILVPNQTVTAGAAPSNTLRWGNGSLYKNDLDNWAPSIGMAWDPFGNGKTSVRSNYRIAYDRINTFLFSSAIFQSAPGETYGLVNQSFGQGGGRLANLPTLTAGNVKPSDFRQPGATGVSTLNVVDPNFSSPTTHQWSFGIQREVASRTVLSIDYIGRRGYRLYGAYDANQADILNNGFLQAFNTVKTGGESDLMNRLLANDSRRPAAQTGSVWARSFFATDLANNNVAGLASAIGKRVQSGRSLPELAGLSPYFFFPYPQFLGAMRVFDSNDFSTYHGLEMQIERRMSNGFAFQASYTLSKSLDTRSFDPAFTTVSTANAQSASSTPIDINNRKLNYARSDFDRRHVFQSFAIYELPFGRGKRFGANANALVNRIIGGWQATTVFTIQAGRPFTVFSGTNTFSNVIQSWGTCNGCDFTQGKAQDEGGLVWFFTPEQRAKFAQPQALTPGSIGSGGRNLFESAGSFNMDATMMKRTQITERIGLELRADVTNLTNTPTFGLPTATANSTIFGRIRDTVTSFSRKMQVGAKITF